MAYTLSPVLPVEHPPIPETTGERITVKENMQND